MLLATKCPYCKTTFKVANDQLKLQSGLVRCGICHQVFNGIEHLAQADVAAGSVKINLPEPATGLIPVTPLEAIGTAAAIPDYPALPVEPEPDLFESEPFFPAIEVATDVECEMPAENLDEIDLANDVIKIKAELVGSTDIRYVLLDPQQQEAEEEYGEQDQAVDEAVDDTEDKEETEDEVEDESAPTKIADDEELAHLLFIRQAKNRKRLRWLLAIGTVLLLVALAGQAIYQFRDYLAAAYPQSRSTLVMLCRMAQCRISLPAQLDAISYEADELHSLAHENTFEFSLLMRNHSTLPQAWPNIELTLKDPKKQVVLRRVFKPSDYLATPREELSGFQAGQEQSVKLYFVVDKVKATDYVVSIFYP